MSEYHVLMFEWFDSLRPINNPSDRTGRVFLSWTSTKLGLMCLARGHSALTPVRLQPAAPRSRVKHSTTDQMRSLCDVFAYRRLEPTWLLISHQSACTGLLPHALGLNFGFLTVRKPKLSPSACEDQIWYEKRKTWSRPFSILNWPENKFKPSNDEIKEVITCFSLFLSPSQQLWSCRASSPNHTISWAIVHTLNKRKGEMVVEIISRSISTEAWDRAGIELANPGSAVMWYDLWYYEIP